MTLSDSPNTAARLAPPVPNIAAVLPFKLISSGIAFSKPITSVL